MNGQTPAAQHSDGPSASVADIDGRRFIATANPHGLSDAETIFRYVVTGNALRGEYRGGKIADGQIIGKVTGPANLELLFQCLTTGGQLRCGQSSGTVRRDAGGLLVLDFEWSWLTGDRSAGTSHYIEIATAADRRDE